MSLDEQSMQIQQQQGHLNRVQSAASWLIFLGAFSLLNSVLTYFGSTVIAAFGLSFTQFADVLIAMLPEVMDEFKYLSYSALFTA